MLAIAWMARLAMGWVVGARSLTWIFAVYEYP